MAKFKHPKITCAWCNDPVLPNAPRMRVHESDSIRFSGNTLAHMHPECGDELLNYLEERTGRALPNRYAVHATAERAIAESENG